MANASEQPIIIKKITKGGHGHHGGAWKVAYADFVTAMMAFFLLMWLLGNSTEGERRAISDFFQNPSAIQGKGGSSTSVIDLGGGMDAPKRNPANKLSEGSSSGDVPDTILKSATNVSEAQAKIYDKERLESLMEELKKAMEASQALKPFKDQLLLDITKQGLRIQIVDKENRPMFASGGSTLKNYTRDILHELANFINKVPNKISITGHTDARAFVSNRTYSNWELSADRSNASRRELINGGMSTDKVAQIVGLSSTVLFDKEHPESPINRRISIIVLNNETEEAIRGDNEAHSVTVSDNTLTNLKPKTNNNEKPASHRPARDNTKKPEKIHLPALPSIPGILPQKH